MTDASGYEGLGWDELSQLFGAYLHQDWDFEYGDDAWDAVRHFCHEYSAPDAARAANQVRRILDENSDEAQIEAVIDQIGLGYSPLGDGWTYQGWLTELEKFLRSASTVENTS